MYYTPGFEYWLKLRASEWKQIEYLIFISSPFAAYTQIISTTITPTIQLVYSVYNTLIAYCETCLDKLKRKDTL